MSFEVPQSPLHPGPNQQVRALPEGQLDIDLNPGFEDQSDDSDDSDITSGADTIRQPLPTKLSLPAKLEEEDTSDIDEELNGETELEEAEFPSITPTFELAYEETEKTFSNHAPISASQQSNLINYLDEELLKIQRMFIKTQSGEANYSLHDLVHEILQKVNIIWLSITPSNTANIEYFIKVLNDLEDYVQFFKLDVDNSNHMNEFFTFLQFVDVKLSYLYDKKLFSSTQFVRTSSIISRLRVIIIQKLSRSQNSLIELEASKIFEGLLERA